MASQVIYMATTLLLWEAFMLYVTFLGVNKQQEFNKEAYRFICPTANSNKFIWVIFRALCVCVSPAGMSVYLCADVVKQPQKQKCFFHTLSLAVILTQKPFPLNSAWGHAQCFRHSTMKLSEHKLIMHFTTWIIVFVFFPCSEGRISSFPFFCLPPRGHRQHLQPHPPPRPRGQADWDDRPGADLPAAQ